MVFIESPIFSRRVAELLDDDDLAALEWALTLHPEAGVLIPGTGGVRKLRWGAEGRGKRGGLRVVYYWRDQQGEIWLLTVYDKHQQEKIPAHVLRALREELMP